MRVMIPSASIERRLSVSTFWLIPSKSFFSSRYENFLRTRKGQKILFLELGVGYNTPVIIKYPFWQMTAKNPNATYACINQGQAVCPQGIERQSVCINADIGQVLQSLSDVAIQ